MQQSPAPPVVEGLYAITDPILLPGARLIAGTEAALAGGARWLQYRDKHADTRQKRINAERLQTLCQHYGARLIINDDPTLAQAVDAAGVHVGRDDDSIDQARRLLGPGRIIGTSCYNALPLALTAGSEGADYVAFGRFFPSRTKPQAVSAPLSLLSEARTKMSLPIVAIGGIDIHNGHLAVAAGASSIAVIAALFAQPSLGAIEQTAQRLSNLF